MTKQCKALELLAELQAHHSNTSDNAIDDALFRIEQEVLKMQDEHEAALAKAAGEWVWCKDELPILNDDYRVQFEDGTEGMGCMYHDHYSRFWGSTDGIFEEFSKLKVIRWFKPAEPPAPPPVKDLEEHR